MDFHDISGEPGEDGGDEPLGRSPSEDPLLSPGRRRKVANGHSSSSRRMPGVLSSSRSSRAGVAVV